MSCVSPTSDNQPSITVVTFSELTLPYPQLFHGRPPSPGQAGQQSLIAEVCREGMCFSCIVWIKNYLSPPTPMCRILLTNAKVFTGFDLTTETFGICTDHIFTL